MKSSFDFEIKIGNHNNIAPYKQNTTSSELEKNMKDVYTIKKIDLHEGYDLAGLYSNDVAILTMKRPFEFSKRIKVGALHSKDYHPQGKVNLVDSPMSY